MRDHLGNTRIVFTDKGAAGIQDQTEILSETHYYPFGKAFDGAWYNDATASRYKYLYNGKELNEEFSLNFYDYGARYHRLDFSWIIHNKSKVHFEGSWTFSIYNVYGRKNVFTAVSKTVDFASFKYYRITGLTPFGIVPSITYNLIIK